MKAIAGSAAARATIVVLAAFALRLLPGGLRAQETALVTGFHHVHMNVMDPARSAEFYVTNFWSKQEIVAGWTGVQTGNGLLLFEKVGKSAPYTWDTALWHFGWATASPADDYKRISANGVKFFRVPPPSAHLIDPDNVDVELAPASNAWTPPPPAFNHVHLQAEHPFCSADWYEKVLGMEHVRDARRVAGDDCRAPYPPRSNTGNLYLSPSGTIRAGRVSLPILPHQRLVALTQTPVDDRGPLVSPRGHVIDHIALTVRDVSAAVRRLRGLGVAILQDTHAFGTSMMRAAMIEGPDRIAIELVDEPTLPAAR